ncbi:MAG TPA: hypothetical protein VGM16_00755 [Gammaproteobacteria bacterium]|jgi:hypothetical protein
MRQYTFGTGMLMALLVLGGCAGNRTKPAPQTPADKGPSKPFVTKSVVFFPDSAGDFELYQKYAYPDAPDGVQLTYTSKTLPSAKLDIFVFVLGRGPADDAVKQGDQRMRGEVQAATKAGVYEDLEFTDDTAFPLTTADGGSLPGRRLRMTLGEHGHKLVSAGYMFYKQLYLVEVRITAPVEAGDILTQVGDAAARTLVPAIHIQNEGGCQDLTVYWDSKDPNGLIAGLKKGMEQAELDGCVGAKEQQVQPKTGEDMMTIAYKPEDWH